MEPDSFDDDDPTPLAPARGKGADQLSEAIATARAQLPKVVETLVRETRRPSRQTQSVVAACNAVIALACRDIETGDAPETESALEVTPGSAAAVRDELTARLDLDRESKRRGEFDA